MNEALSWIIIKPYNIKKDLTKWYLSDYLILDSRFFSLSLPAYVCHMVCPCNSWEWKLLLSWTSSSFCGTCSCVVLILSAVHPKHSCRREKSFDHFPQWNVLKQSCCKCSFPFSPYVCPFDTYGEGDKQETRSLRCGSIFTQHILFR